jgi:hypothetical protein
LGFLIPPPLAGEGVAEGDGWGIGQGRIYRFENTAQICIHLVIPKPQDVKAIPRKMPITLLVKPRMIIEIMLTAIDLND